MQQTTQSISMSLPRPDGGGVGKADGGGLSTPSPSSSFSPSSPLPIANSPLPSPPPSLTEPILDALLDPAMTPTQICQAHSLTLDQLLAIIESQPYKESVAAIERINSTRQQTINSNLHTQSLAVLRDIATDALVAAQDAASCPSPVPTGEVARAASRRGAFLISSPSSSSHARTLATQSRLLETARKATTTLHKQSAPVRTKQPTQTRKPIKQTAPIIHKKKPSMLAGLWYESVGCSVARTV